LAATHCGVAVGRGVEVGRGVAAAHSQLPAESEVHCPSRPSRLENEALGHTFPGSQAGEITHGPPHGTAEHCGSGVRIGHCKVQIWSPDAQRCSRSHA
jgi:hypothetical protein